MVLQVLEAARIRAEKGLPPYGNPSEKLSESGKPSSTEKSSPPQPRVRARIVARFVARYARRCLADRVISAESLEPRSHSGTRKLKRGKIPRNLLIPIQTSYVLGTALTLANPTSLSSIKNVRPLFCVAMASCGRK